MKTEVADLTSVRKRLTIEIPASEVSAVFDHLLRKYRKNVNIPGFRPGKAPLELIKARVGHDLEHEAAESIVEDFGREACRQEGIDAVWSQVDLPEGVDHLPHPHEGEDYRFSLLVEVMPNVDPTDYTGQEIARPSVEVEVEEVQKELEALRQSRGKTVDVTDRASAPGDFVGVDLEGIELGGEAAIPREFRVIRLGDERNLPEFETALTGRRAEDDVAFEVTYPAEVPDEKLSGKVITFRGTVKAVKRMDVPEWDDELAKEFGSDVAGFADLREKVKEVVRLRKEREADQVARQRLVDRLLDRHPFEIPPVLVEVEVRERLERLGRRLAAQGVDVEKLEIDWKRVIEEERQRAEREVRANILLDRIAEKERDEVRVLPQEIDAVVAGIARDMKEPVGKVRQYLQREGRMASLLQEVQRNKCLDWLYGKAHIS